MKKVLLCVFACMLLASCSRLLYRTSTSSLDFSKFSTMGFFVTESNSVSFEYVPVGSVSSYVESGFVDKRNFKYASEIDALSLLYNKAISMGANGIINLRKESVPPKKDKYGISHGDAIIITGMAIKTNSNKANFLPIENSYYTPVITEKAKEKNTPVM